MGLVSRRVENLFIGSSGAADEDDVEAGEADDGDAQESNHHHQTHPAGSWQWQ